MAYEQEWIKWFNAKTTTHEDRQLWFSQRVAPVDVLPQLPVEEKITMVILSEVVQLNGHNTTEVLVFDNIAYEFIVRDAEFGYSYGQQVVRHAHMLSQTVARSIIEFVGDKPANVAGPKRNALMFAQRVSGYPHLPDGFKWVPITDINFDKEQSEILRKAAFALGLNYEDKKRKGRNQQ